MACPALVACLAVEERHSSPPPPPAVASFPGDAWTILGGSDAELGFVVRFEEVAPTLDQARTFFSVRNIHGQELGLVDDLGRAWRYRPHALEPDWVGTDGLAEGVARILGSPAQILLQPAELQAIKNRLCLNPAETPTRQGS
jgi:hypothetical protein